MTEDTPTSLKDNFALYVNKDDLLALEIPEGYARTGTFYSAEMQQAEDIKNMFLGEAPQAHDAKLAYNLFQVMMDWDSRNAQGVTPLREQIDLVEAIDSIDALIAYFVETPAEDLLSSLWAAGRENFDYDKFFRANANFWLVKDSLQNALARLSDEHPMLYLRINCTLQQFDEFLDFYGIKEGDGMYLAPEDRVAIW